MPIWRLFSQRRRPESNRCKRLCRPLRSHSATSPRLPHKGIGWERASSEAEPRWESHVWSVPPSAAAPLARRWRGVMNSFGHRYPRFRTLLATAQQAPRSSSHPTNPEVTHETTISTHAGGRPYRSRCCERGGAAPWKGGLVELGVEGAHNHGFGGGLLALLRRYPQRCLLDGAVGHPDLRTRLEGSWPDPLSSVRPL